MAVGTSYITAYIDSASPPTIQVTQTGITATRTPEKQYFKGAITFLVPPNYYYKVIATKAGPGVTCTLINWSEWELF